jgi:glycosyltransferase involved in cell wall biosynthesis
LLESFSGTYLEAMHFERPILTSDLDFAHDICGDAAEFFDPWQPASIKDAIVRLREDEASRKDLVAQGQVRLRQTFHSWGEVVSKALADLGIPLG